MKTLIAIASFILLFMAQSTFAQPLKIPACKNPLVDGVVSMEEWTGARLIVATHYMSIRLGKSKEYFYVAVASDQPTDSIGYVSVFISDSDNRVLDLHSSARLGERALQNGQYPDWGTAVFPDDSWFNHSGWTSNYAWFKCQPASCATLKFAKAKEFQIERKKFVGSEWAIRVFINFVRNGKWETVIYPANTSETTTTDWLKIKF